LEQIAACGSAQITAFAHWAASRFINWPAPHIRLPQERKMGEDLTSHINAALAVALHSP
jgi:hypothetical protein